MSMGLYVAVDFLKQSWLFSFKLQQQGSIYSRLKSSRPFIDFGLYDESIGSFVVFCVSELQTNNKINLSSGLELKDSI